MVKRGEERPCLATAIGTGMSSLPALTFMCLPTAFSHHPTDTMNLIAYSDSESEGEAPPAPKPAPKSSFAKVVDRSNPGRIKVNLPGASGAAAAKDDIESEAPPAKKPRLGGGSAFGGFNAMLPAPKKPVATGAAINAATGKRALGKGLASGINLKTGAEPAFRRESRPDTEEYDEQGNPLKKEPMNKDDFRAMLNLPASKSEKKESAQIEKSAQEPQEIAKTAPKPAAPRFMPMSVGRGKKKKPIAPRLAPSQTEGSSSASTNASVAQSDAKPTAPPRKPKVSLFGTPQEVAPSNTNQYTSDYQPLLSGTEEADYSTEAMQSATTVQPTSTNGAPSSNELTNIASELNLSEAERRQLFGKRGRAEDFDSARVVEFNTDAEYAHNEMLRLQGEQVQHNPLKSISGTGKNSLRSLVNVASTQKDALEDHFASGYRNKKEAGNKYGW